MELKKLSLKEKVGQKFMFGVNSNNIDVIIDLIKNYYIGGVILYKRNYNSYDEMLKVIKRLKDANKNNKLPLFIAIDQEGGRVNRMPSEFRNIKNVYDMSKKDNKLLKENGLVVGEMLTQSGINMNFAPVLDMCNNSRKNNVLYKRCFYGNVDNVSESGRNYIDGMNKHNIISVVKHFPGHGVSKMDSHFITPIVFDNEKVLNKHIKPFENIIKDGIDAVMVNHLVIRKMTDGLPASISYKFINEYLRKRNKFNGLVITDEINMLTRNILYKFNYMKRIVSSGSDIVLVKIKDNKKHNVIDKYIKYLNNDNHLKLLDDSVERIINIKKKYNINDNILYDGCNIDIINDKIEKLNNNCI